MNEEQDIQEQDATPVEDVVDEVVTDEAEQPPVDPPAPQYEEVDAEEARAFGWKAPDEWAGEKPPGYIDDPKRFLERIEQSRPFKVMSARMTEAESRYQEEARKMAAMNSQALERQKAQYEAEVARINTAKRNAVELADTDAYDAAQAQFEALQAPAEPEDPATTAQPTEHPDVASYRASNEWAKNPLIWQEAAQAVNHMPNLQSATPAEQLQFAEGVMKQKYPHLFQAPAKPKPQTRVDGGGLAGGGTGGGAFTKLPGEAKTAFKRFVSEGLYTDDENGRKSYADEYNAA